MNIHQTTDEESLGSSSALDLLLCFGEGMAGKPLKGKTEES